MQWPSTGSSGARQTLTAVSSHFLEQDSELELLGSRYKADLTTDKMEALFSQTHCASESLSSRVPPSAACSPPNDAREE
jgi:hypothetical protein